MGILGIAIQSHTGIPLFLEAWSEKLRSFHEGNPILIAGFLSAISSFASHYRQEIGYIRFIPTDFPEDQYGIDGIYSFIEEYMILCFTDPYQFHRSVHLKIEWIYRKILFQYKQMIKRGRVPFLKEKEQKLIYNILMDNNAREHIFNRKDQLEMAANDLIEHEFSGDVYGCFITSFDNTILFQYGMDRTDIEKYMNNIGNKGADLYAKEILYNYGTPPAMEPRLVVMTNSGVNIQISNILRDIVRDASNPLYYYLIADANCSIGPIVESLIKKFNAILL